MPRHPLLLPALLLFVLHQLLQKWWHIPIPLLDQYLDPLLCMPILVGLWEIEQKMLFKRHISNMEIIMLTIGLSLLFEIGFPRFSPHFTADWWDAALYFLGTFFYILLRP